MDDKDLFEMLRSEEIDPKKLENRKELMEAVLKDLTPEERVVLMRRFGIVMAD